MLLTPRARVAVQQLRASSRDAVTTPFTGNELHCLEMKALRGDSLAFGNSVRSLGLVRGVTSMVAARAGGTNHQLTDMIRNGRQKAFEKMIGDAKERGCDGVVGVSTTIGPLGGLVEFMSYGACVKKVENFENLDPHYRPSTAKDSAMFSATCGGEQYYCLREMGFHPKNVVFGNEAYSTGFVRQLKGAIKKAVWSGEIRSMSDIFNVSRGNAMKRMREEAFERGCNFVSGVRMQAVRMPFIQEVNFHGTACVHPGLPKPTSPDDVFTSAVPEEELWSLIAIGKRPVGVITGCSVYNLGMGRSVTAAVQQLKGGEATRYTELTSQARQAAMRQLNEQAAELGADEVVSVRIVVEELKYGMVEFFAYGTAVKNDSKIELPTAHLPPQVLMGKRKPFSTISHLKPGQTGTTSEVGHVRVKTMNREVFGKMQSILSTSFSTFRWVLAYILDVLGKVFPFLSRFSKAIYSPKNG
eukprot:TRINITY_DN6636_c0_g1_i8.p1 TRINITY_DN6636_c0_g1~~TRINITY_DN6636_c0_g1_i8.p1  ORF type:complete len:470 (+),score=121.82 TRINITY_DN6636_c0_g1_i8:1006-2415(+)